MDINTPFISDPQMLESLLKDLNGEMEYSIMNDFLSKYTLQNDLYALTGLLAALLHIDLKKITNIEVLNPIELSDVISGKDCILDIKLELNHHKIINIEIQSVYQDFWPERSITYLCRLFDHLDSGANYGSIKPCVHIGIVNHDLFKESDPRYTGELFSEYRLLNTKTHQEYSSKFEIRVLSLNHLDKATDEDKQNPNGLYYWAKFFNSRTWGDLMEVAKNNHRMKSFVGTVRKLTAEEKVAEAYEARRRYLSDIATYEYSIACREVALAEKDAALAERDAALAEKDSALAEKDSALAEKDSIIAQKDADIERMQATILELKEKYASLNSKD